MGSNRPPKSIRTQNPLNYTFTSLTTFPSPALILSNQRTVPPNCKTGVPPFPIYRTTIQGHEFLAFFTKIYGFSNHHPAPFTIQSQHFCCSEQFYMYRKALWFGFELTAAQILASCDASTIKRLGSARTLSDRLQGGMEPYARPFNPKEWEEVKEQVSIAVMMEGLRAKFIQNDQLRRMLMATGHSLLVEASANDKYWGIGCAMDSKEIEDITKWRGENRMGFLLMRLRHDLGWN